MSTDTETPLQHSSPDRPPTLLGQTMGLVALTTALFAAGAYLARDLGPAWGWIFLIVAVGCTFGLNFAVKASEQAAVLMLGAVGICFGAALAPGLAYYAATDPRTLVLSAVATGLFIAGFGAAGYATRRDLSGLARTFFWALVALIVFGVVLIFVQIPGGAVIYGVIGLVIFAGLTAYDFQRLRRSEDIDSAPILAASIFLDILNVFLLFQSLFSPSDT